MKKLLLLTFLLLCGLSVAEARHPVGVSFEIFYSSLSPHGEWISVGADLYAWRPVNVYAGWRPYYMGRWIWTDDGWYWATDEPWGWATYHYGRWYYDDYYGWIWIPGYDWAPAWVEWRYGGDYIGWAPLGPYAVFNISFGIHYTRHWVTPYSYWTFVDCHYINHPQIHRYAYRTENNTRFIGRTRGAGSVSVDRGRVVTRGPDRAYVERRGGVRIERAEIIDGTERGRERITSQRDGRQRIETYRPQIDARERGGVERPSRVREYGRSLNLDEQSMDVRARDRGRLEGRDLRRSEEYNMQRRSAEERRDDEPSVRLTPRPWSGRQPEGGQTRRLERQAERVPTLPPRDIERRSYEPRPYRSERQIEQAPERRREPIDRPPRIMQRPEPRSNGWGGGRTPTVRPDRSRPDASSSRPAPGSRGGSERRRGR